MIAYPISGGVLNPAIGFGICLVNVIEKGTPAAIQFIWVYVIFPFIGALLAIIFYEKVYKRVSINDNETSVLE